MKGNLNLREFSLNFSIFQSRDSNRFHDYLGFLNIRSSTHNSGIFILVKAQNHKYYYLSELYNNLTAAAGITRKMNEIKIVTHAYGHSSKHFPRTQS